MNLFADDWGVDTSPVDDTEITTTILYFSKPELAEFKGLCRTAMMAEYPQDFQTNGNISDLLLKLLKQHYANA